MITEFTHIYVEQIGFYINKIDILFILKRECVYIIVKDNSLLILVPLLLCYSNL